MQFFMNIQLIDIQYILNHENNPFTYYSLFYFRDAREDNAAVLKSLGAEVVDAFSDTITHLVWSNGSAKKLTAASLFDITVVSPSWILECEQSGKH
jgi:hypothetical protein